MDTIYAIIYLPEGETLEGTYAQQCLAHIEQHGYTLYSVLYDWDLINKTIDAGPATVVVVAREEHLDPRRTPRVEFVGHEIRTRVRFDQKETRRIGAHHRRPRIIS
ncbi:hypothetical protein HH310_12665 [Actinoplanes sp. TBRC 11911]|uniref:hypothetical protein n=1 Tax=Actinoplanes sp. TBRC 11911 TaxID=2729386 RepID=UPI00145C6B48|nr:hypothetical protein [Actinoplanes sp. TBRC 11911]NMO52046.1 hypothetical protein [Actinoplanes sp. TBRC 11911]